MPTPPVCRRSFEFVTLVVALHVASLAVVSHSQTVCPPVSPPPPPEVVVDITADGMYVLYVDGSLVGEMPNYDNAMLADQLAIPPYSRLLGVSAIMFSTQGGILASVNGGHYFVTSSAWKCHDKLETGWDLLGFDDSHWMDAVEIGLNGDNPTYDYGCIAGISPNAYWIWTSGFQAPNQHRTVWCRGYLPLCTTLNPCLNGGTCLENSEELCICPVDYAGETCDIDLNPCRSSPCLNGGTCTNSPGGMFSCECSANYTGNRCQTMLNACDSSPCANGGTCINGGTFYLCSCSPYYTGARCESDVPADCGNILHNADSATLPSGWSIGCYIGIGDESYWSTPCYGLLQGLSYYGSSEQLMEAGGNYGCWMSRDSSSSDVYNACFENYGHDAKLTDCFSCTFMAVCVKFP